MIVTWNYRLIECQNQNYWSYENRTSIWLVCLMWNATQDTFVRTYHFRFQPIMVMHRALFTWFILLVFFILLCLRLESRTHWNWFLIFVPMWLYDLILLINALFNIFIRCKHENIRKLFKNKNILLLAIVLLKIAAQITLCLKLEYKFLSLELYHVLLPIWILLPILIMDVSITLFGNSW